MEWQLLVYRPVGSYPNRISPNLIGEPITFRSVGDFPDPAPLIPHAFPWILAAGQPYYDWFCGDRYVAERTIAMWMRQTSSEISLQRVQFLQYGSEIAGGIIGLSGAELRKARIADTDSFWATLDARSRGALIERLSQSVQVFAPVGEDEYYASRMGLSRSFLGKGVAKFLLERFLDQGNALGYSKFRADVQTENEPCLRCCLAAGFEIFYTGQSADGALRYHALRSERKNK
jgi:GNAT superfamily N-acetyltransferase